MLTVKLTNGMQSVNTCYTTIKNVILVKSKRFLVIIRKPLQLLMLYSNVKLKIKNQRFLNYQNQIVLFNPCWSQYRKLLTPEKIVLGPWSRLQIFSHVQCLECFTKLFRVINQILSHFLGGGGGSYILYAQ